MLTMLALLIMCFTFISKFPPNINSLSCIYLWMWASMPVCVLSMWKCIYLCYSGPTCGIYKNNGGKKTPSIGLETSTEAIPWLESISTSSRS